jgi:MoaA/NifB/PqqE/SkfB family radical SAM enzyme
VCQQALLDAKELGFARVQFTGGDPLLYKELPQLVAEATALSFDPEIYTNGLSLSPSLLSQLTPHRPAFAFSFYSANAEAHDQITRVPGSQKRTLAAIERVQKAGLALRVGIILMEQNAEDFEATEALLKGLGVEQIAWSGTTHVGRGDLFRPERAPSGPGVHQSAPPQANVTHMIAATPSPPTGNLCLSSNGEVYPCIFNRATRLGSIHESSLQEIARSPSVRSLLMRSAQERLSCYSCRLTDRAIHQKVSPEGVR